MDLFAIVCPQCGSNDVSVSEKSNDAVCNSCGTKFLITDKQPNWYEENAVYEPAKRADRKLKFKPLYSTDVFLRKAIISILKKHASLELLGGTIAPVKTSWRRMLSERAIADVGYGGSVGYHRTETYVAIEERYDKETQQKYKVPVEKTRTVTDWRPISGEQRVTSVAAFSENEKDGHSVRARNFGVAFRYANDDLLESDPDGDDTIVAEAAENLHYKHLYNYQQTVEHTIKADDMSRLKTFPKREARIETVQWKTPLYETTFTAGDSVVERYDYPIHENVEVYGNGTEIEDKQKAKQQQEMQTMMTQGTGMLLWISIFTSAAAFVIALLSNLFSSVSVNIIAAISAAVAMFGFMFTRAKLAGKISNMTQQYEEKRIAAANAMLKKIGQKELSDQESGINETKTAIGEAAKKRKLTLMLSIVAAVVTVVSCVFTKEGTFPFAMMFVWCVCMFLMSIAGKNEDDVNVSVHRGLKIVSLVLLIAAFAVNFGKMLYL